jgi:hypothetical protein
VPLLVDALGELCLSRRVELVVRIVDMLQKEPTHQREIAETIYRELLMPAGGQDTFSGDGSGLLLLRHLIQEREAALTRLADECFHECLRAAAVPTMLQQLLSAASSKVARDEAAERLRNNRVRILKDLCDPLPQLDLDGDSLMRTQQSIRIAPEHVAIADEALRELERRLHGKGLSEPLTDNDRSVWAAVGAYLRARVRGDPRVKPHLPRWPHMSVSAANELHEVISELSCIDKWSIPARREAGLALRNNRARVLMDVCNPSKELNIDGKPLTQLELTRVSPEFKSLVEEALCEIERRLLDEGSAHPMTEEACRVWT